MTDRLEPAARRRLMQAVRGKDTAPELALRSLLHRMGYRFRLHARDLPGKPDLVFRPRRKVIFVHGCFWHRHGCKATTTPRTNVDFWRKKFDENIARDRRHIEALQDAGWRVAVVWECSLKGKSADPDEVARLVSEWLGSSEKQTVIPANEQMEAQVGRESED